MSEPQIERRIFVVGVPRSGTTLVQSLLAAHSRIASFTESHFFSRYFTALPRLSTAALGKDPAPRLREFLAENGFETSDAAAAIEARLRRAIPPRFILPVGTQAVARELLYALDKLSWLRHKENWIEKTPRHLRFVPFLERVSGSERPTHFIHVIREGLEVVASLSKASQMWETTYDLDKSARRWNADAQFSLTRVGKPNDHFVFYEELTLDPESVLRGLLADLGLDWEPDIVEQYTETSSQLITREESWKEGTGDSIRPAGTSSAMTAEDRARVQRLLRQDLYQRLRDRSRG